MKPHRNIDQSKIVKIGLLHQKLPRGSEAQISIHGASCCSPERCFNEQCCYPAVIFQNILGYFHENTTFEGRVQAGEDLFT